MFFCPQPYVDIRQTPAIIKCLKVFFIQKSSFSERLKDTYFEVNSQQIGLPRFTSKKSRNSNLKHKIQKGRNIKIFPMKSYNILKPFVYLHHEAEDNNIWQIFWRVYGGDYGLVLLKTQDRMPAKFVKYIKDGLYELRTEYNEIKEEYYEYKRNNDSGL